MGARLLVVNADDFGFTPDVNQGIIEAHTRGILTATTLMANGAAFDDAVRLAREHPTLDVGVHGVLVQGESLHRRGVLLPRTVRELIQALALRRFDPYAELRAQASRILDAGLRPLHVDTHKHTHLLMPVLDAVARLSRECGIPWVRRPYDVPVLTPPDHTPWKVRVMSRAIHQTLRFTQGRLERAGCRTTDHFTGFQLTGRFRLPELVVLAGQIPEGTTELMCHPGRCGPALQAAVTRLKESREVELEALIAPEMRAALDARGVRLVRYRDLG